jgi:cob(I)yrinic acid a,c-diamide adenosyltransferase (EC 2.5.1.17)
MSLTPEQTAEKNARHAARMARKKAVIDAAIASATDERGLLIVITGNGKGKSTSAFGTIGRALGYGMKIGVCQFIKSRTDTGEEAFFGAQPNVEWHVLGTDLPGIRKTANRTSPPPNAAGPSPRACSTTPVSTCWYSTS